MKSARFLILFICCIFANLASRATITLSDLKINYGESGYSVSDPNYVGVTVTIDVRNNGGKMDLANVWILDENNNYLSFNGDGKTSNGTSYFQVDGFWRDNTWVQHWYIKKDRLTFLPAKGKVRFMITVQESGKEVARIVSGVTDLNKGFASINKAQKQQPSTPNAQRPSTANTPNSEQNTSKSPLEIFFSTPKTYNIKEAVIYYIGPERIVFPPNEARIIVGHNKLTIDAFEEPSVFNLTGKTETITDVDGNKHSVMPVNVSPAAQKNGYKEAISVTKKGDSRVVIVFDCSQGKWGVSTSYFIE